MRFTALRLSLLLALSACGAAEPTPVTPAAPSAPDAGVSKPSAVLAPPNVTLPPERPLPAVTLGSKIAKVKGASTEEKLGDAPLPACMAQALAGPLAALTKACAPSAKPIAAPTTLVVDDSAAPTPQKLSAERGACYRFLIAADAKVEGFVLVVMDSKGAVALEARTVGKTLVAPSEGPLCFDAADNAEILVSGARGTGRAQMSIVRE